MAANPIPFNPQGGALTAVPTAGHGAQGSYSLTLFEADGLTIVQPSPFRDRFKPAKTHALPGSAAGYNGRVLVLLASVGLMDATRAFAVHLSVMQDGQTVGTVSDVGQDTGTSPTHESKVIGVLTATTATRRPRARRAAKRTRRETLQLNALRKDALLQRPAAKRPARGNTRRATTRKRTKRSLRRRDNT